MVSFQQFLLPEKRIYVIRVTIFGDEQVQSNSSVHQEHSFLHVVEPQLASIRVYEVVRFASGAVDSCQVEQVGGENAVDI